MAGWLACIAGATAFASSSYNKQQFGAKEWQCNSIEKDAGAENCDLDTTAGALTVFTFKGRKTKTRFYKRNLKITMF